MRARARVRARAGVKARARAKARTKARVMESSELQRPSVHELGGGAKGLERAQVAIELLDVREHGLLHRVDLVEGGEPHISRDLGPRRQLVEGALGALHLRGLHSRRSTEVVRDFIRVLREVIVKPLLYFCQRFRHELKRVDATMGKA